MARDEEHHLRSEIKDTSASSQQLDVLVAECGKVHGGRITSFSETIYRKLEGASSQEGVEIRVVVRLFSDLIRYENLSVEALTILMLKMCQSVLKEKTVQVILPDCIYILYLDPSQPQKMKV